MKRERSFQPTLWLLLQLIKATVLAESSFIFSCYADVCRRESNRCDTLSLLLTFFCHFTFPGFPFILISLKQQWHMSADYHRDLKGLKKLGSLQLTARKVAFISCRFELIEHKLMKATVLADIWLTRWNEDDWQAIRGFILILTTGEKTKLVKFASPQFSCFM